MVKILMNPTAETEQVRHHVRKTIRTGLSAGKHHLSSHAQAFLRCGTAHWPKYARVSYGGCQGSRVAAGIPCVQTPSSSGFFDNLMVRDEPKIFKRY